VNENDMEREEPRPVDTLMHGLRVVRKYWLVVAGVTVAAGAGAFAFTSTLPKIYEAETLLEFDPDVIKPLGNKADPIVGWSAIWDTREYYETQYRIMQSDRVLSAVVRDLRLEKDKGFTGSKSDEGISSESAIAILRSRLIIEPVKGSRLVLIKIQDPRPAEARRLSDTVARTYIQQNLDKMVNATGDTVVWLSSQLDHFKQELEQTENALHEFKKKNDLPSSTIEDLSKMIRLEMQEFDSALSRTRLKRSELAARSAELAKITADNPDQIPASELLSNAFLSGLRVQYQSASRERAELTAEGKGQTHPAVRKADEKLGLARSQLLGEIKNIQAAIARDVAVVEKQESSESALYENARKKAVELNLKELEFHRLDRLRAQNEKLYAVLLEQTKEADLRRLMNTNNIRLVDAAKEPHSPIAPRVGHNVAIAMLAAVVIGIAAALVRDQLDNTLKTPDDIEQRLGLAFLGLLPQIADEHAPASAARRVPRRLRRSASSGSAAGAMAPELCVHDKPTSAIAEAARAIRTNLTFMNPDKPLRRLLVTSAAPSEGKTTVAVSIAISLAQGGHRVCIVDGDLRRPRLHRIFGRSGDRGLTHVIVGEASIEDVAQPTAVPNLSCIPCGAIPPNSADVLSSARFRQVLDAIGDHFDRVVIDSPPVVAVTDSAIVSTLVDGVVFVVRAFGTSASLSRGGLRALRDVDAPLTGAVLNAVDFDRIEYSNYQLAYYKREGYASHDSTHPDAVETAGAAVSS